MRLYEKLQRFADDPVWRGFAICDAKDCGFR
jgi:hypothetical protein